MPKVPVYERQIQSTGLPAVRASTDAPIEAFGGGKSVSRAFEAGESLLGTAAKIHQEEKQKADNLATIEAQTKTVQEMNRLLWDTKEGAYAKRGKDALGVIDDYGTKFKEFTAKTESSLITVDQKQLYSKIRQNLESKFDEDLQKHTFKEHTELEKNQTIASISVNRQDAVMNYTDIGRVNNSIGIQQALVDNYGRSNGLSQVEIDLEKTKVASGTHADVIARMITNQQDIAAKSYFDKVQKTMTPEDVKRIEGAVAEGSLQGQAQRSADKIFIESGGDLEKAMEATKSLSGKSREYTEREVKERFQVKNTSEKMFEEKLFDSAANYAEENKKRPDANTWSRLKLNQRNAIDARIEQLRHGIEVTKNGEDFYNLMLMASTPETKSKFLGLHLTEFTGKVHPEELRSLINEQTALKKGDSSDTLDTFSTKNEIVNRSMNAVGIDPTPKDGSNDAKAVKKYRDLIDENVRVYQDQTGKKATSEVVQKIADTLLLEAEEKGGGFMGWFGKKKRAFELESGKTITIQFEDIPADERRNIIRALEANKQPATNNAVIQEYLNRLALVRQPRGR